MKNLMAAFLKAQQDFPTVAKDATNPAYKSRYATLGAVQEAAFPTLWKNGLVVFQSVRTEMLEHGLMVYVAATLYHVDSGEQVTQELGVMPTKSDPQGLGSATTYLRRYILMTMLGLVADDDDGAAASAQAAPNRTGGPQNRTNVPQGSTTQPAAAKPSHAPPAQPQAQPQTLLDTLHATAIRRYGSLEAWTKQQQLVALWASNDRAADIVVLTDAEIQRILDGWAKKDKQQAKATA